MPATLHGESVISRSRSGQTIDLVYIVKGTNDDTEAVAVVLGVAPGTYDGKARRPEDLSIEPLHITSDDGWWIVRVPYSPSEWGFNVGADSYTFDTSGGTQHIQHSRAVAGKYPETAPDIGGESGGLIGATADGVSGTDIPVPVYEWEETHIFSWGDIDATFKRRLRALTGRVNNAAFQEWDEGEVLFMGVRGARLPDNTGALTFRFAQSDNITASGEGLTIGAIEGIQKEGWQVLDIRTRPNTVGGSGDDSRFEHEVIAVYVHDVFVKDDFSDLGIS